MLGVVGCGGMFGAGWLTSVEKIMVLGLGMICDGRGQLS